MQTAHLGATKKEEPARLWLLIKNMRGADAEVQTVAMENTERMWRVITVSSLHVDVV